MNEFIYFFGNLAETKYQWGCDKACLILDWCYFYIYVFILLKIKKLESFNYDKISIKD